MTRIVQLVDEQLAKNRLPSVHPHHSMLYPLTHIQRMGIAARHASLCQEKVSECNSPEGGGLRQVEVSSVYNYCKLGLRQVEVALRNTYRINITLGC